MAVDPFRYFRVEAVEILEALGKGVLAVERGEAAVAARLLRLAHTLKGAARVVKLPRIAEHAHALESLLEPLRAGGALAPDATEQVLRRLDAIRLEVDALPRAAAAAPAPAPVEPARTLRAEAAEVDALLDGLGEVKAQLAALRGAAAGSSAGGEALRARIEGVEREVAQVWDVAERLRLLPADMLFAPLERTLRDAAHELGARVEFQGNGGDVRVEGDVLSVVQAALVQLVRNAIAHGIEPEAERRAAGKRIPALVTVAVERRGPRLVFSCTDDGRGIDLARVREAAVRAGVLAPDLQPTGDELLRRLLGGGLSTAPAVTEVAGRGIGLDVVREAATRLGGELEIDNEPGRGLRIGLVVPASRTAVEALVVESGGTLAAIPLVAVLRTLRVTKADAASDVVSDGGEVIPLVPLRRLLAGGAAGATPRASPAVIVAGKSARAALAVERLVGASSVVVRALPPTAPALDIVAGASIDAEGTPRLVLDPEVLVTRARALPRERRASAKRAAPILVVDDSLTTRMLEQSILEAAGYEVDVATSAEEGLARARRRRYGICLVDVEMPGMDGFAFLEAVRSDAALRALPCVVVSSRDAPADAARARAAGAVGYVVKSEFDQRALLELIRVQVGGDHRGEEPDR